ncbi:hypothetical protein ACFQ1I_41100 [Kitasatospora arboriphila]
MCTDDGRCQGLVTLASLAPFLACTWYTAHSQVSDATRHREPFAWPTLSLSLAAATMHVRRLDLWPVVDDDGRSSASSPVPASPPSSLSPSPERTRPGEIRPVGRTGCGCAHTWCCTPRVDAPTPAPHLHQAHPPSTSTKPGVAGPGNEERDPFRHLHTADPRAAGELREMRGEVASPAQLRTLRTAATAPSGWSSTS